MFYPFLNYFNRGRVREVNELKNIIRKANQMVPPPMKEMLPQDMKNAMDKVGQ